MVGHHFAQAIHLTVRHLQNTPAIAQNRTCLHLSEGDDLRDMIVAIFLLHISDHFAAPRLTEVDIEVRHRNAFGIEETLEQQTQLDWIEIGDCQCPCDEGTRTRTTPRPHWYVVILGPLDKVRNDQEVTRETHPDDDVHFVIEPVEIYLALLI